MILRCVVGMGLWGCRCIFRFGGRWGGFWNLLRRRGGGRGGGDWSSCGGGGRLIWWGWFDFGLVVGGGRCCWGLWLCRIGFGIKGWGCRGRGGWGRWFWWGGWWIGWWMRCWDFGSGSRMWGGWWGGWWCFLWRGIFLWKSWRGCCIGEKLIGRFGGDVRLVGLLLWCWLMSLVGKGKRMCCLWRFKGCFIWGWV